MIFYADFCDYSFIFVGVRLMGVIGVKVNVWGEILSSNVVTVQGLAGLEKTDGVD